jgi:hypothetical protein
MKTGHKNERLPEMPPQPNIVNSRAIFLHQVSIAKKHLSLQSQRTAPSADANE